LEKKFVHKKNNSLSPYESMTNLAVTSPSYLRNDRFNFESDERKKRRKIIPNMSQWVTLTRFTTVVFNLNSYSVFQGFSKAKSANGGLILSSSQFLILPQLPQKIKLASKVVKVDSKIIISLPKI